MFPAGFAAYPRSDRVASPDVAFLIGAAVVVGLVLLTALLMDLYDRRHGRTPRVRTVGWLHRSGQASAGNSPEGFLMDVKGVGSAYSSDELRDGDDERPSTD